MSDIWEPWVPEPGQRVRVRLSGECPGVAEGAYGYGISHLASVDGMHAVVERIYAEDQAIRPDWPPAGAHRIWVTFEPWFRYPTGEEYRASATYAAAELEPVP